VQAPNAAVFDFGFRSGRHEAAVSNAASQYGKSRTLGGEAGAVGAGPGGRRTGCQRKPTRSSASFFAPMSKAARRNLARGPLRGHGGTGGRRSSRRWEANWARSEPPGGSLPSLFLHLPFGH